MVLLEKVQKQIPSADQALVDRTLGELGKTEAQVLEAGQVGAFIKRCRDAMGGSIEPAVPVVSVGAIGGVVAEEVQIKPRAKTVMQAQAEREAAMLNIANADLDQEVRIYSAALDKANEIEAAAEAKEIEDLAAEIVNNRQASRKVTRGFLKSFGEQSTARVLHQFGGIMAELPGQTVEAEVVG